MSHDVPRAPRPASGLALLAVLGLLALFGTASCASDSSPGSPQDDVQAAERVGMDLDADDTDSGDLTCGEACDDLSDDRSASDTRREVDGDNMDIRVLVAPDQSRVGDHGGPSDADVGDVEDTADPDEGGDSDDVPLTVIDVGSDVDPLRCRAPEPERSDEGFGYFATTRACEHQFVDIAGAPNRLCGGTGAAQCPSSGSFAVTPCAPLVLYGAEASRLFVSTEGYISLDPEDGGHDQTPDCPLAAPSSGVGARIAPMHDNLNAGIRGGGLWHQRFERCPRPSDLRPGAELCCDVVQWRGIQRNQSRLDVEFEAVLYEGGEELVFAYLATGDGGERSSTGLLDASGENAFTIACDSPASVLAHDSICVFAPEPCGAGE